MPQILPHLAVGGLQQLRTLIPQGGPAQIFLTVTSVTDEREDSGAQRGRIFARERFAKVLRLGKLAFSNASRA
jgi:hypothetical protein